MTRTAVLSDIHGNLPALEAVVADAEARGCIAFINLGDIVSGPLWPAETADYLMARGWPTIKGNHERQLLTQSRDVMGPSDVYAIERLDQRQLDWLKSLPATLDYSDEIFLSHGTPSSDLRYFLHSVDEGGVRAASETEVRERIGDVAHRLTLCGHTHAPRNVTLADGRRVANPGSVGLQAYEWDVPHPHHMETGDAKARYAIVDNDLDVTFHTVDYDYKSAVSKARTAGRKDWAIALEWGRVEAPAT